MDPVFPKHGADLEAAASRTGHSVSAFLDASGSLAPWTPVRLSGISHFALRNYPDSSQRHLKALLASHHSINAEYCLVGNGASDLLTWAARDAASMGISIVPAPGFSDYPRSLSCWDAHQASYGLSIPGTGGSACDYPALPSADVVWLCNPHNPSGQLWSRSSLKTLLSRYKLVICDEAFLPLVPDGEDQSLIPLVEEYTNLVVIRSLTKLYGIAGLRLGYAVAQPDRLARWASWRDPWPVNGIALYVGEKLLRNASRHQAWCRKVQRWTAVEGGWLHDQLSAIPGLTPMPSAANFLLLQGDRSLVPLREALEQRHRILLRDCRSFEGLGERWLRIGYQSRRNNRRIVSAIRREWLSH